MRERSRRLAMTARSRSWSAAQTARAGAHLTSAKPPHGSGTDRSVEAERHPRVAYLPRRDQGRLGHFHRMQPALDVAGPEIQESPKHRVVRRHVELLPDE